MYNLVAMTADLLAAEMIDSRDMLHSTIDRSRAGYVSQMITDRIESIVERACCTSCVEHQHLRRCQ